MIKHTHICLCHCWEHWPTSCVKVSRNSTRSTLLWQVFDHMWIWIRVKCKSFCEKACHPLVVVGFVLVDAAVGLVRREGEDTVGRGVEQPRSLLGHQQSRGVLHTAVFLHIVHLQQEGENTNRDTERHTNGRTRHTILCLTSCWTSLVFLLFP